MAKLEKTKKLPAAEACVRPSQRGTDQRHAIARTAEGDDHRKDVAIFEVDIPRLQRSAVPAIGNSQPADRALPHSYSRSERIRTTAAQSLWIGSA